MERSLICVLFCCIGFSIATAQGVNRGGFTLYGGFSVSANQSSTNEDDSRTGYNAGFSLEFALSHLATFRTSLDYNSVPFDGEKFLDETGLRWYGIESIKADPAQVLMVFGSLEVFFKENRNAKSGYLILGAGYFSCSIENIAVRIKGYNRTFYQNVKIEAFALQIGLGVEFPMGDGASFFIESSVCAAFAKAQVIPFVPTKGGFRVKV